MKAATILVFAALAQTALGWRWTPLSNTQRNLAYQIMAAWENLDYDKGTHSFRLNYGYCENIDDGQGITIGFTGFTTDAGDAMKMLNTYSQSNKHNPFTKTHGLFSCLKSTETGYGRAKVNCFQCHSSNCHQSTLCNAAKAAFKHDKKRYVRAQQISDQRENYQNMQKIAKKYNIWMPISQAFIYDSCVNHDCSYDGNDVEGFIVHHALRKVRSKKVGTSARKQKAFFNAMLSSRNAYMHDSNGCDCGEDATWRIPGWSWLANTKHYWTLPKSMSLKAFQDGRHGPEYKIKCNPHQYPGCGRRHRKRDDGVVFGNFTELDA